MALTRVVWNPIPSEEIRAQFRDMAAQMAADGKTDGTFVADPPPVPETGPYTIVREWTTVQDAEAWIAYSLSLATPAEYEVIST